jgi:hypothetical protein
MTDAAADATPDGKRLAYVENNSHRVVLIYDFWEVGPELRLEGTRESIAFQVSGRGEGPCAQLAPLAFFGRN